MRLLALASIATLALAPIGVAAQTPATAAADATAPTTATTTAAASDDTRIRCRRVPITGSHVRVERVCKTVAEWRRLSDRGNDAVRAQADTGRICAGGTCGNGN